MVVSTELEYYKKVTLMDFTQFVSKEFIFSMELC